MTTLTSSPVISLGAYDRFNYGDLLFPVVLDYVSDRLGIRRMTHSSTQSADLRSAGGHNVLALKNVNPDDAAALVLGGGEILGANWSQALASNLVRPFDRVISVARRVLPKEMLDYASRISMRGSTKLPYLPTKNEFRNVPLFANAIGASSISELSTNRRKLAIDALGRSAHLSVRDKKGASILKQFGLDPVLVPDSAAILKRIHPVETVDDRRVLSFQCSAPWFRSNEQYVVDQLTMLSSQFSEIRLVPIGLAGDHSDDKALLKIQLALLERQVNVRFVEVDHIWDVANAIGTSSVFVGSSLHGNITAMAYGIPSVGLCQTPKLTNYLQTWGDGLRPSDIHSISIASAVLESITVDANVLELQSKKLDELSWANSVELIEKSVRKL